MVLKTGSKGAAVAELQRLLAAAGITVTIDGDYGQATAQAVAAYQHQAGLVEDGAAGPRTLDALRTGQRHPRALTEADIQRVATRLGVTAASVRAVCEVESDGSGFGADGHPDILFERHVFYRRLAAAGLDADALAARYPDLISTRRGGYAGGVAEWGRLNSASSIHSDIACESTSWGLFQIMGYHWQSLGYDSVQQFVSLQCQDEGQQLEAFARFIEANPPIHRALRDGRWAEFARLYNGPQYRDNLYDVKLARAAARYEKAAA